MSLANIAVAAERIVQLTIPGCFSWGASKRIGTILKKIDGVKTHERRQPNILIITFDDERTSLEIVTDKLKEGTFAVKGKPVYLK